MKKSRLVFNMLTLVLLSSCALGPDYQAPHIAVAQSFKQAPKGWKIASPGDDLDKGQWWLLFKDRDLTALIEKVNISNQNIAIALAQYQQSLALVKKANANYLPSIDIKGATTQQNQHPSHALNAEISWAPDLFGVIAREQESIVNGAQASAANLAHTKLAMQALLAQTYFQLRAIDVMQRLLDHAVYDYKKLLKLTKHRYESGVASRLNVIETETQLQAAIAKALDNKINRAQYEHALAILIGQLPDKFSLETKISKLQAPVIPLRAPSYLLERRPDIAQAERLVAQANAKIGIAQAAYFPVITLTGSYGVANKSINQLFAPGSELWSLGAQLAANLLDGGARSAAVDEALAAYNQSLANYKQTVLNAFGQVEDNLVALRILESEIKVQDSVVTSADLALQITMNQYKSGTADYSDVIQSFATFYQAKQNAANLYSKRMIAAVNLIQALGGGWDPKALQ